MQIKQVEERLNVPRTHIRYLEREKLFSARHKGENKYRDFSEEDIQELEMVLILMKAGVSASDVKALQAHVCTLEDVLRKTEADMREKADQLLGGLELIQKLRASYATYDNVPRDSYWSDIQKKEAAGKRFMGHYELEDVSDWVELRTGFERIVECPSCQGSNRIDLEQYVYNEYYEGEDRDGDMGPTLTYEFDTDDTFKCRKCQKIINVKGWIQEYPVGAYDSEEIQVSEMEDQ